MSIETVSMESLDFYERDDEKIKSDSRGDGSMQEIATQIAQLHSKKSDKLSLKNKQITQMGSSVQAEVSVSWGGSEGTKVSGSLTAEAHDDDGNYVEVEAEANSDGEGTVSVKTGSKDD